MRHYLRVLMFLPFVTLSLYAQEIQPPTAPAQQKTAVEALKNFEAQPSSGSSSKNIENELRLFGVANFPCTKEQSHKEVLDSCLAARKAFYDYYAQGLPRRARVYEWNNFSTRVIFFVVLTLVGIGVYFSWKQFFGVTLKKPDTGREPSEGPAPEVSELEIGLGGIKVKSPVLGVILLALSLAFFYLYLQYVYPVTTGF